MPLLQRKLDEAQKTNVLILKTLNELIQSGLPACNCPNHEKVKQLDKDMSDVRTRVEKLATEDKVCQREKKAANKRLAELQSQVRELETTLLGLQTDDSKLQKHENQNASSDVTHVPDVTSTSRISSHGDDVTTTDAAGGTGGDDDGSVSENGPVRDHKVTALVNVGSDKQEHHKERGTISDQDRIKRLNFLNKQGSSARSKSTDSASNIMSAGLSVPDQGLPSGSSKVQSGPSKTVEVLKQTRKRSVLNGDSEWRSIAQNLLDAERPNSPTDSAFCNVLCLDISESMAEGEAWSQANIFIRDFLAELDDINRFEVPKGLPVNAVSLTTFGHDTSIRVKHTKKFDLIRNLLATMKVGGPSPLNGGLFVALAIAMSAKYGRMCINLMSTKPRIIVITDGRLTELDLMEGPDEADKTELEATKSALAIEVQEISARDFDFLFVPVGNADVEFLKFLKVICDGKMRSFNEGRRAARFHMLHTRVILDIGIGDLSSESLLSDMGRFASEEDKEDIKELKEIGMKQYKSAEKALFRGQTDREDFYIETDNSVLPPIGSRVRRGPDWHWGNQDNSGLGTVVGHNPGEDRVWVEWDFNGSINIYGHGRPGFDLVVVNEPRVLRPGQHMAAGCLVRPGKDNRSADLKVWDRGVVIRIKHRENKAQVRWENGKKGDYSYGADGKYEIELWKESGNTISGASGNDQRTPQPKKNKNA